MSKRIIKPKVIKELYAKSGNQCAFPGCNTKLFDEESNNSQICHIEGLTSDSARYNPKLSDDELNSIDNLILLCPTHHSVIDQKPYQYTVDKLKKMKQEHEERISQQLKKNPPAIFYKELQLIFQECSFDRILLEQSFEAPFEEIYFNKIEEGYSRIFDLLNTECSLNISGKTKEELYGFAQLLENIISNVAMISRSNGNGIAIPGQEPAFFDALEDNIKVLRKIYKKYRFC